LKHEDPTLFHRSEWNTQSIPSLGYVAYRITIATVMTAGIIAHIISTRDTLGSKWLIYMTNQGISFLTIHYILYAIIVSLRHFMESEKVRLLDERFPLLYSFSWGLHNAFTTAAFLITLVYWGVLNKYVIENNLIVGVWMNFLNVFLHLINSLSCLLDIFITARPIKFGHWYLAACFGVYYTLFSAIYWAAGGKGICRSPDDCDPYIYPILDWENNAGFAILTVFGCTLMVVVLQGLLYGLYCLRLYIKKKLNYSHVNSS